MKENVEKNVTSKFTDSANQLKDIRDINIDVSLPKDEKIREYIKQINNPYHFKCGDITVKLKHVSTKKTIEDCLNEYMATLQNCL